MNEVIGYAEEFGISISTSQSRRFSRSSSHSPGHRPIPRNVTRNRPRNILTNARAIANNRMRSRTANALQRLHRAGH